MRSGFVDPGTLRARLTLESVSTAPDGQGGFAETWNAVAALPARIEPVDARAGFGADQTLETVTHRVTVRFRDGLASGMRFRKAGRIFDILTVHDPDESGRYLVCRTKEKGL